MEYLVEREQEKQGPLGRRIGRAYPAWAWAFALLPLGLPSCQDQVSGQQPEETSLAEESAATAMLMWSGGQGEGPYILVEQMDRPAVGAAIIGGEEGIFRKIFSLPEDTQLLRVHILEDDPNLGLGAVQVGQTSYLPLKEPPEDADTRARLYWYSVARGAQDFQEDAASITRVTHLVAAEKAPPVDASAKLQWRRGDLRIDLVARDWTGPQRRSFLDAPAAISDE